jgi:hypothetical protein
MKYEKLCWKRGRFFVLLLVTFIIQKPALPQSKQTFPSVSLALQAIRASYLVSTGFEMARNDLDDTPVTLVLSGTDVARVFENLVVQRPSYAWRLEGGVYDLYPKLADQSASDLVIQSFVLSNATRADASDAISRLSEFQQWLSAQHATRQEFIVSTSHSPKQRDQRISLVMGNTSLHNILNPLIKTFGDESWTIDRHGDNMEYIGVYF